VLVHVQVLASIGQLEFFYDQAPDVMRSCSMALQLLSVAAGSYLSGLLCTFLHSFVVYFHPVVCSFSFIHSCHLAHLYSCLCSTASCAVSSYNDFLSVIDHMGICNLTVGDVVELYG
jgi:hypothetical protein